MKTWGLVIQGPRVTYGQGAKITPNGFDSAETVTTNVLKLSTYFDECVVSTWTDSEFVGLSSRATVIRSKPPKHDPDNRRKQFVSTSRGLEHLRSSGCSHAVKIRTDQLIPPNTIEWIQRVLETNPQSKPRIIASEYLPSQPFYVGDFLFAGSIEDLQLLSKPMLGRRRKLHPVIGLDYTLRLLREVREDYYSIFSRGIPAAIPLVRGNAKVVNYWAACVEDHFRFLPWRHFEGIYWRGSPMSGILDWTTFGFGSNADGRATRFDPHSVHGLTEQLETLKYQYGLYYRRRVGAAVRRVQRLDQRAVQDIFRLPE